MRFAIAFLLCAACGFPRPALINDDAGTSDAVPSDAAPSDAASVPVPVDAAPMDFTVTLSASRARIVEGASATIDVTLSRNAFTDAVNVAVAGLPTGVRADPLTIEGNTGTLTLHAAGGAMQGDAALTITAIGAGRSHDVALSLLAMGTPGTLDQSFAASVVATGPVGRGTTVIEQPDGKILTVAAVAFAQPTGMRVARYLSNGMPDPSFSGGSVMVASDGKAAAIALQADGKIVVVGGEPVAGRDRGLVTRLESNGSLDTAFGISGRAHFDFSDSDPVAGTFLNAVALQHDGGIVIAGRAEVRGGVDTAGAGGVVARLTPSGTLDPTFGTAGISKTRMGALVVFLGALTIQPDGRIIVLGKTQSIDHYSTAFGRFTMDGQLDSTFNGVGYIAFNNLLTDDYQFTAGPGAALTVQSDGKIAAVGAAGAPPFGADYHSCLIRLNGADGSPDTSLGPNGVKIVALGSGDHADALAIQPDGKWLVFGSAPVNAKFGASVARFTTDAFLDLSFGGGVAVPLGAGSSAFRAATLDAEGRILVTGDFLGLDDGGNYASENFILARIWP